MIEIVIEKPEVSIIVPVYNVDKYVSKCLESLIAQQMQSIEIIVVNDGSTDNSSVIVDEYGRKHPDKIRVFHKDNGGLASARNYGLALARGQYIAFVDSDDWIKSNMIHVMYQAALEGYDLVVCDFIEIYENEKDGKSSNGYRGQSKEPSIAEYIINSLNPATACNKFFHRSLFKYSQFLDVWYEDMATTPILASYAKRIKYLPIPLYYYRQRLGSIIQTVRDRRTLGVIRAWQHIIETVNPEYHAEVVYAVYKSIFIFLEFKPEFSEEFLFYAKRHKMVFLENKYVSKYIYQNGKDNLFLRYNIPKKIHYCWFGQGEKSDLIKKCIESWEIMAPDYEVIEWNETNCNMQENAYVREAYQTKKWAFVADYFRVRAVFEHGGIYLDTDVELKKGLDSLRQQEAFFAFETDKFVNAHIFGAISKHSLMEKIMKSYQEECFILPDGSVNTKLTIPKRLTKILVNEYSLSLNGSYQSLQGISFYPPNYLTIDVFDGRNIAEHHFDASWMNDSDKGESYKHYVLKNYFISMLKQKPRYTVFEFLRQCYLFVQRMLDKLENSPLRGVVQYLRLRIYRIREKIKEYVKSAD